MLASIFKLMWWVPNWNLIGLYKNYNYKLFRIKKL